LGDIRPDDPNLPSSCSQSPGLALDPRVDAKGRDHKHDDEVSLGRSSPFKLTRGHTVGDPLLDRTGHWIWLLRALRTRLGDSQTVRAPRLRNGMDNLAIRLGL